MNFINATTETDPKAYNGTLAYNSSLANYYPNSNPSNFWNDTYATFNKTYSDTLYSGIEWDYNQTIPANTYSDSLNNSLASWVDNLFVRFTEITDQVGNWSADKVNYYNKTQVNDINSSMKSYVDSQDNLQDECSEISGCVVGAITSESDPYWTGNQSNVARTGNCPSGQFVQNTTTGGVQCLTPSFSDTNETARFDNLTAADCGVGYLVIGVQNNGTVLCAADSVGAPGAGDIESVQGDNIYIYNGSTSGAVVLVFNETKLNETIDLRDSDTTYSAGSNLTLTGTIFAVNMTSLKAFFDLIYHPIWDYDYGDLINKPTSLSNFTNDLGFYNSSTLQNVSQLSNNNIYWNSTFATFNKTYGDTLYYGINNPSTFWNSTFATFNKTYADTLYSTIAEPRWSGNYTTYNASWSSITNTSYLEKAGGTMTGNLNISNVNITSSGSGKIYTNSTCIKLSGATSTLEIC